jgi:acetyl-CoA carboxylase biotin carboxyl carrier protein
MAAKAPRQGREGGEKSWNLKEIQDLIDLLTERGISEFELEKGGTRIRIKRGSPRDEALGAAMTSEGSLESAAAPLTPSPAEKREAPPAAGEPPAAESTEGLYVVKSPIVGTFYRSPAPNAPPFVEQGDRVKVGQTLCIIEAMKLMNEIESEVAGEVVRCYIENGQPVEYGQSLFALKPSHKP